jgi:hypothetical protein
MDYGWDEEDNKVQTRLSLGFIQDTMCAIHEIKITLNNYNQGIMTDVGLRHTFSGEALIGRDVIAPKRKTKPVCQVHR